ncbi:MAG: hypothetical protein ACSLEM_01420 [Candidatus Malihini olakiniferum]
MKAGYAMEAGLLIGMRTILTCWMVTTTLFDAKQKLSNARYDYLIN